MYLFNRFDNCVQRFSLQGFYDSSATRLALQ